MIKHLLTSSLVALTTVHSGALGQPTIAPTESKAIPVERRFGSITTQVPLASEAAVKAAKLAKLPLSLGFVDEQVSLPKLSNQGLPRSV